MRSALSSTLLDTTGTVLVKPGLGRVNTVCILTTGAGTVTLHDSATTGGAATTNRIAVLQAPAAGAAPVRLDFQFVKGLVVVAGAERCSIDFD